jgi:hypothetical protein
LHSAGIDLAKGQGLKRVSQHSLGALFGIRVLKTAPAYKSQTAVVKYFKLMLKRRINIAAAANLVGRRNLWKVPPARPASI